MAGGAGVSGPHPAQGTGEQTPWRPGSVLSSGPRCGFGDAALATGWMPTSGDGALWAGALTVALLFFVSCSSPPDRQHLIGHHRE